MSCKFRSTVLSLPVLCERLRSCGFLVSSYGIRHCTLVLFFCCSRLSSCLGTGICSGATLWLQCLRVHVFLEFMALDRHLELCKSPLVPPEIEGICPSWLHGADGGACRLLYAVHQMLSLWSLYRCGSWSPRPQPLGSG